MQAVLVLLLPRAVEAAGAFAPTPVVITTDCGADMDDQWAIAHAALSHVSADHSRIGRPLVRTTGFPAGYPDGQDAPVGSSRAAAAAG